MVHPRIIYLFVFPLRIRICNLENMKMEKSLFHKSDFQKKSKKIGKMKRRILRGKTKYFPSHKKVDSQKKVFRKKPLVIF